MPTIAPYLWPLLPRHKRTFTLRIRSSPIPWLRECSFIRRRSSAGAWIAPGWMIFHCAHLRREAVKIFLVFPGSTDQPMLDLVGHSELRSMIRNGVRVYRWDPQEGWSATKMLHTKTWLIDYQEGQPALTYVGSAKATQRSFFADNEMGIVSSSPDFAHEVRERLFQPDLTEDSLPLGTENLHTSRQP